MTKLRLFLSLPLLLLTLAAAGAATFDPQKMMDTSEIKRGDQATSKSVFSACEITEFRLEIIDIMSRANLGADMILARVLDGPVVERESGIIGGMSGSPVYIKGRLIGAIAWGWGFSKEPIAGIMPIRPMLEALDLMQGDKVGADPAAPASWTASRPITLDGKTFTSARVVAVGESLRPDTLALRPVGTPINCSGVGPQTMALLKEKLSRYGVSPMPGGGQRTEATPVELVPGAAVGVRYMEGDFDMTGIGTVTYREGNKILAFGHPLMQLGKVNLPLTTAWINDFIPSYDDSNKMGCGMRNVGSLRADIPWAIGGEIGPEAPLVPARIEILDKSRNLSRTFNIKVFRHPGLTPLVLASGISSALEATFNPGYEGTIRSSFEIKGERGARLKYANQYFVQGSPVSMGCGEVTEFMTFLEDNRWKPQEISELVYRAEISDVDETLVVEKIYTDETVAKAGKPLTLHVTARPDNGEVQDYTFKVNMPQNLPKGTVRIGVGGGMDASYFRGRFGIMTPNFEDLDSALQYLAKLEHNTQLCVVVALPGNAVAVGGSVMPGLPASVMAVLEKSSRTDLDRGREELLITEELPWIVYGRETLSLSAEDAKGAKGAPASAAPSTPPSSSSDEDDDEASISPGASRMWLVGNGLKPTPAASKPLSLTQERAAAETKKPDEEAKKKPGKDETVAKDDETDKGDADADEDKPDDDEEKTVVRQLSMWTQTSGTDFASGEAVGAAVRSDGTVTLAPAISTLCQTSEFYVWNSVTTANGVYFATSDPGRVYRVTGDGKPEKVLEAGCFGVHGLTADAAGNVYAGTWPGGKIYKITPDGKSALFAQLNCEYVWSLAFDQAGTLLAGVGPSGRVLAVDAAGVATQLVQVPQTHVLAMLPAADGLYLATADKGLVYRLLPDKQLQVVLDTNGDDATALAADEQGTVYAASSGGKVYKISGSKVATIMDEKTLPVYALQWSQGRLLAATGTEGKLIALAGDVRETVQDTDTTHLLCLSPGPADSILVGAANAGGLLKLALGAEASGTFTSSVLDAKRPARWGVVDWQTTAPEGAEVVVQTRSGNSADPDRGNWSVWSGPYSRPGQDQVTSPTARYLQYRLQMKAPAGKLGPELRRVSIAYLPANQQPKVEFDGLKTDKPLRAMPELKWTASDPDSDKMLVTLEYRPAGTPDWKSIKQLPADEDSHEWDTTKVTDGLYDMRVVVTDEVSNPGDALVAEQIVYRMRIDNTKPELLLQKVAEEDGKLVIEGIASDVERVGEVAWQVEEQWRGATPADGLFDGQYEQFRVTIPLVEGKAKTTLRVRDLAGNVVKQEVVWPKETEAAKDAAETKG